MVITQRFTPKQTNQPEQLTILDLELRPTQPFERITRTASGGFQLHYMAWDEFDNKSEVTVVVEKSDVEVIKEMISKGLL